MSNTSQAGAKDHQFPEKLQIKWVDKFLDENKRGFTFIDVHRRFHKNETYLLYTVFRD